ncbi:cystathionine beta-lyase [Brevundimonas terrae]|uniref:Cystathionine beta-lyase n=1 Tax=Brevundimonas terrae TaxID=363631 RepID=A0ABP3I905_9CAUL|nr:cystathionine beta-lyase [Brevundimonas terrae]NIJ26823.1 cystathionine beta-lyase [Brevundimonas terrae]
MSDDSTPPKALATRLISPATQRGKGRRPVNPPIERASTMLSDDPAQMTSSRDGPVYGLEGGSAARQLRSILADMEGAHDSLIVPSGLAAVTVPLTAILRAGDEVMCTDAVYGPTRRFLTRHMFERGIQTRFHPADASTDAIIDSLGDNTRVLLIEAPGSLTFEMVDMATLARACKERGIITIVDNTWGAGLAYRPLEHGIDISVQALTKYVGGHSDILMGAISVATKAMADTIFETIDDNGWHVSPDDAWLALRGIRTLPLRYRSQFQSAMKVVQWLEQQPQVSRVLYPPLPSFTHHELWNSQFDGAASLFGVVMKGGSRADAHRLMSGLSLFGMGYSWGGFESLVTYETPQLEQRLHQADLEGQLMRFHIGLEDTDDLIADLHRGLSAWPT